jgi:hypothetical protein
LPADQLASLMAPRYSHRPLVVSLLGIVALCVKKTFPVSHISHKKKFRKKLDIFSEERVNGVNIMADGPDMGWFAPFKPRT